MNSRHGSIPRNHCAAETEAIVCARFDQLRTLQMSRTNMQNEKFMIITGGSSGIGRAAALRFANQGSKVLITGRRAGPVEQTVAEHQNIAGIVATTASAEDAKRTIATAVDNWGRVDALVNNAGAG